MSKIQVTLVVDDDHIIQESGQPNLGDAIDQELGWLRDSGMYVEEWNFLEKERNRAPLQSFFYTFDTSDSLPFKKGWVECQAEDRIAADKLFRAKYPDANPGIINCSSIHNEDAFRKILEDFYFDQPSWKVCHDILVQPGRDKQKNSLSSQIQSAESKKSGSSPRQMKENEPSI